MLISEAYREQNRLLHERDPQYGAGGEKWAPYIAKMVNEEGFYSVLDYGCGKGDLGRALKAAGIEIAEYDPAIPGKDKTPEPAELVVCTDVLEHIEPVHLNAFLRELRRLTKRRLFFNVATRPAAKTLPDGRNAHLIVKPADWWREKISKEFHVVGWQVIENPPMVYGEAIPLDLWNKIKAYRKPTKRRALTPEWAAMFDWAKREFNKYADPFSRIETIRMWEDCGDEPADVQVACNILEHLPEPDVGFREMIRLSRKAVMATIVLDKERGEDWWRKFFERRVRITDWICENGAIIMIGAPKVDVQGVTAYGAVDPEERFNQVKAAIARFPRRIEVLPAHERTAIICCYGPSLADSIEQIKHEIERTGGDVISVSGAHDFLLQHGIVPKFHIECDPRAHKADNIEKGHPGVTYLLGSCCHPVLFDKLEGFDVRLWHVAQTEHTKRLVHELSEKPEHVISGGGSVGLRSIPLLYALGYRDMSIFGMDCSFRDDGQKQWAGRHAGKKQDVCQVLCGDRLFYSSPILLSYATNFWETVQKVDDVTFRLMGDGLLQHWARINFGQNEAA